jgi:uncharacterized membrane protein
MAWSSITAAFLASFVELVEALTIVLAAAAVRGWRPALSGAAGAAAVLAILIVLFGPHLTQIDTPAFHLIVGFLLLLFGLRWLKKAILRSAGVLKMHDEAQAFEKSTRKLESQAVSRGDAAAMIMAFNGVFIEGIEVVFIVLAVGASTHNLVPPAIGAAAAAVAVILLGVAARHPLTRIPENALKFAVGVLICAFGTFWVGEGIGVVWPWSDYSLIVLSISYAAVAGIGVAVARTTTAPARQPRRAEEPVMADTEEA